MGTNNANGLVIAPSTITGRDQTWIQIANVNGKVWYTSTQNGSGGHTEKGSSVVMISTPIKIVKTSNTFTVTFNNTTETLTNTVLANASTVCIGVDSWMDNHTSTIRNITVKAL